MTTLMTLLLAAFTAAQTPAAPPPAAAPAPAPAPVAEADPAAQKLFLAKCASCHAKDGKGAEKMIKMLKTTAEELDLTNDGDKTDAEILKIIADGENKMPAFKKKLTEAEIASLAAYVRFLSPAIVKTEEPAAETPKAETPAAEAPKDEKPAKP